MLRSPLIWAVLWFAWPLAGPASAQPRDISDISALIEQHKPDVIQLADLRRRYESQPPAGATGLALSQFYLDRAWASESVGDPRRAIADFQKSSELAAGLDNEQHRTALQNQSNANFEAGNLREALRIREQVLALSLMSPGRLISLGTGFVSAYAHGGDVVRMREAMRRTEVAYRETIAQREAQSRRNFYDGMYQWTRAIALTAENKPVDAEGAWRSGLASLERDQADAVVRADAARRSNNPGMATSLVAVSAQNWAQLEISYARFLMQMERLNESEVALRRVLTRTLARLGRYNPLVVSALASYAELLYSQGRFDESIRLTAFVDETCETIGMPPESLRRAQARRVGGSALAALGQWEQAARAFEQMRNGLARDPAVLSMLGRGDADWALSLIKTGHPDRAVELLQPEVAITRQFFGEHSGRFAMLQGVQGMALAATGRHAEASKAFLAAVPELLSGTDLASDQSPGNAIRVRRVLEGYIEFLVQTKDQVKLWPDGFRPIEEAFRVADFARSQRTQNALIKSAARAAVMDQQIGNMVREEQDLRQELARMYGLLLNHMALPPDQQAPKFQADMRARIDASAARARALLAEIGSRVPKYAELANPRPTSLEDARRALRPGEVLLSVLSTDERTYVWAANAAGASTFHAFDQGEPALARSVEALRRALDPASLHEIPAFNLETAHGLYRALLEPARDVLRDQHTLVVTVSGALSRLPLSVLVTESVGIGHEGPGSHGYRSVAWLVRKHAIVNAPSVTSFVRLRALSPGDPGRKAFAGFADPVFDLRLAATPATGPGAETTGLRQRAFRSLPGKSNWPQYNQLSPLPDTRDEILGIAAALGADPREDVFVGPQATRRAVLAADLSKRRVLAFATHGLIPGDLEGLSQPALALSATGQANESPLLTLDDVMRLRLDADWVVLSACNTASGDTPGAEAMSGLARGFFYAGTRALLVTQWPVETVSAKLLTSEAFRRHVRASGTSRARALQQSMLQLMDTDHAAERPYAHPLFWAPYVVVGDGS